MNAHHAARSFPHVGATNASWNASISAQETFTAPPTCVRADNHYIFLPTDDNISGQVGKRYLRSCQRSCGLASTAQSNTRWNGHPVSKYHTPRAIRLSGYFNTRHLGTAAIISSGPWHRALAHRGNPLNRANHCASSLSWGKYSCPFVGRRALEFLRFAFPSRYLQ